MADPAKRVVRIDAPTRPDPVRRLLVRRGGRIRNLSLHRAPVDDTLRMFADMGRFNVVIPAEVGARRVTLDLRDVSLAGAFQAVLASARLEATVIADDIVQVMAAAER